MAAASQKNNDETQEWVSPIPTWFQKLVQQAGLEEKYVDRCWTGLQELGIKDLIELRAAVRSEMCNGLPFNLADIDVPRNRREHFKNALLKKRIAFSEQEVRVSLALSRLAYDSTGPIPATTEDFEKEFEPQLLQRACCPNTQQKYIVAVVGEILYIAFAGTHQKGDWSYNLWLLQESAPEAGGSVHGGFRKRALNTKFSALHRLAVHHECNKLIFTGHSLGGAVATLSCLFALQMLSDRFKEIKPFACSFAAPLVASAEVSQSVEKHGWTDRFVNFVNSKDPVPRLLNLTQSVPKMLQDSAEKMQKGALLFEALGRSLGAAIPGLNAVATGGVALAQAAEEAMTWVGTAAQEGSAARALDAYHPLGVHVVITDKLEFKVLGSEQDVLQELGPAELLSRQAPCMTTVVAEDNVRSHDIVAYEANLKSRQGKAFLLEDGCAGNSVDSPNKIGEVRLVEQLKVEVDDVTVLTSEDRLVYGVYGQNLDFISAACVEINPRNVCDGWGRVGMEPLVFTMIHQNYLNIEQPRQNASPEGAARPPAMPASSPIVMIRMCPDIGDPIEKPLRVVEGKESLACTEEMMFDENLLRRILKHAWLKRHFHNDESLMRLLVELVQTVPTGIDSERLLHDVRQEMDVDQALGIVGESEEIKKACGEVVRWLCPSGGLKVTTQKQLLRGRILVGFGVCLGCASLAAGGGMSFLFGMMNTGGWGTLISAPSSAALARTFLFQKQLKKDYRKMLTDLLHGMGFTYAATPKMPGWSTSELEAKLVEEFKHRSEANKKIFDHGDLEDLISESVDLISARIKVIGIINQMRGHIVRGVVSICGPQNHGKTTLVSQLLMLPESSLKMGLDHQGRTRGVRPYQWGECKTAFLLDSPGVDSRDKGLMNMFSKSGGLVGSAYVYVRLFNGVEQRDDVETISSIMQASSTAKPHVLILLNKISSGMRDATGRLLLARELEEIQEAMKKQIIADCTKCSGEEKEMPSSMAQLAQSWVRNRQKRFDNVKIVFAELGMSKKSIAAHPDLKEINDIVYTAKDIGMWLTKVLDPNEADDRLKEAVNSIDYDVWAKNATKAREEEEEWSLTGSYGIVP